MANVYISDTPQDGCVIRVAGREERFATLDDARSSHPLVAEAQTLLRKGSRLMADGALRCLSSYQLTPQLSATTGQFDFKGCLYQFARFAERLPNGAERVTAAQVFPLQPVPTHMDCFVSAQDTLDKIGFATSVRTFLG
jgi:hypothetical protein